MGLFPTVSSDYLSDPSVDMSSAAQLRPKPNGELTVNALVASVLEAAIYGCFVSIYGAQVGICPQRFGGGGVLWIHLFEPV
jgi:hypothetical protein